MRVFGSVRESVFLCLLVCCALMCGTTSLAAQTTAVAQESAALSAAQFQIPKTAMPLALGESPAKPRAITGYRPSPAAAKASSDSGSRKTEPIIWGAILLATIGGTLAGDAISDGINFPESAIPVVGPFIAIARYDDVVTNPYYDGKTRDKILFATSGIVQTAVVVMLIRSLRGGGGGTANSLKNVPIVSLVPTGRRGFLLSYQKQF